MNSAFLPPEFEHVLTTATLLRLLWGLAFVVIGYLLLKVVVFIIGRAVERRLTPQSGMIVRKIILYVGMLLLFLFVLGQFGVQMTALLGAAGILGIGLGFAAQTSVSHMISGMFLISEKAFAVGDLITVGETTGFILSIDLLSVKLRTLDNRFVRVPNEDIIKTRVTNITRFPIRRMDMDFTFTHSTDLARVHEIAVAVGRSVTACLDEPEPLFMIQGVTPLGCEVRFGIWFPKAQFIEVRNSVLGDCRTTHRSCIAAAYSKV